MGGFLDPQSLLGALNNGGASSNQQAPQPDSGQQQPTAPQSYGQQQTQGIKGYLSNIFYNMGEAAKAHLGMPTDAQLQQNQQKIDIQRQQVQAETAQKWAQIRQMSQMVTLPNGMSVPFGVAKPYLDYAAKQYAADAGARAKITAEQIGKRFIPIAGVGMFDTQDPSGTPSLVPGSNPASVTVTDDIAKEYGVPDQLKGKTIPLQQFSGLLRGVAQFTPTVTNTVDTKEVADPNNPGSTMLVQVPKSSTSQKIPANVPSATPTTPNAPTNPASPSAPRPPVSLTNRNGIRILTGPDGKPLQGKSASDTVYATDPKTGQQTFMLRSQVPEGQIPMKVNDTQVRKDQSLSNRLADVQRKVGDYADSFSQPIDDQDKQAIAYLMQNAPVGAIAHMGEIPLAGYANNLLKARGMQALSPNGIKRLVLFNQARESLAGYQQILTGSSRGSDTIFHLQEEQLPPPLADSDFANTATSQFQQNIDLAGQHIPIFPGSAETQQTVKAQQVARRQAAQPQGQPPRPANVPQGYIYRADGPKGAGWYRQ